MALLLAGPGSDVIPFLEQDAVVHLPGFNAGRVCPGSRAVGLVDSRARRPKEGHRAEELSGCVRALLSRRDRPRFVQKRGDSGTNLTTLVCP